MSEPAPPEPTRADELLAILRDRGWTVGAAESLTGGLVSSAIVEVPGASAAMRGGVVAYDTAIKASVLGVDADLLARHGPVHPEVARQMALGVRRVLTLGGRPAEVGISTTGIAGPSSPDGQPVGTVWVGVSTPAGERAERHLLGGDRAEIRDASVRAAIALAIDAIAE
ncbi:CinA family protein [Microbacterium sp. gxy059]|uniref:CinA family protein n=1 Tax=Microbacterium sp. gxy059 TaxID=2957199 RepID=UPI003D969729